METLGSFIVSLWIIHSFFYFTHEIMEFPHPKILQQKRSILSNQSRTDQINSVKHLFISITCWFLSFKNMLLTKQFVFIYLAFFEIKMKDLCQPRKVFLAKLWRCQNSTLHYFKCCLKVFCLFLWFNFASLRRAKLKFLNWKFLLRKLLS